MRRRTLSDVNMMIGVINHELSEPRLTIKEVKTANTLGWQVLNNGEPFLFAGEMPLKALYDALCYVATGVAIAKGAAA